MASIGPAIAGLEEDGPSAPRSEPLLQMMAGVSMAQVALGVLGALLITGEYASRSITGTLAAVPQRGVLLAGKALLLVLLVTPFALLSCTLAALTSLPVLRGRAPAEVASMTAMAMGAGYVVAAAGPALVGAVHDATDGWDAPLVVLLGMIVLQLPAALRAVR